MKCKNYYFILFFVGLLIPSFSLAAYEISDGSVKALYHSEDVVDSSGKGNNLTNNNSVTFVSGKLNNAGNYVAASSQFLSHVDNGDLSVGDIDFTVGAWVKLSDKDSSHVILGKLINSAGYPREYQLDYSVSPDRWIFSVTNTSNNWDKVVAVTSTISVGTWYFVLAWHDSVNNVVGISADNTFIATSSYSSGVRDGTADFNVGASGGLAPMSGDIDEVFLIKRLLTDDEKAALYNAGVGVEICVVVGCGSGGGSSTVTSTFSSYNFVETCISGNEYVSSSLSTMTERCYSSRNSLIGIVLVILIGVGVGYGIFKIIQI